MSAVGMPFFYRRLLGMASPATSDPPMGRQLSPVSEALKAAYGLFLAAFREAAERLKAGDRVARFPTGCFPPGLPFVGA
jgi:hypothetical protein